MLSSSLLLKARLAAGLSQEALARRARTSRPTLSAYERGHKSPSLATAGRIVGEAGFDLALESHLTFVEHVGGRGRPIVVPSHLPRLGVDDAFAVVELPLHLNWSDRGRKFDLGDRRARARVYEIVLREGTRNDVLTYIDGLLLADLWEELVLPTDVRSAWAPLVACGPIERVV